MMSSVWVSTAGNKLTHVKGSNRPFRVHYSEAGRIRCIAFRSIREVLEHFDDFSSIDIDVTQTSESYPVPFRTLEVPANNDEAVEGQGSEESDDE